MRSIVSRVLAAGLMAACGPTAGFAAGEKATAEIKDATGKSLGTAEIVAARGGALIKLKLAGLPPGRMRPFPRDGRLRGRLLGRRRRSTIRSAPSTASSTRTSHGRRLA